MSDLWEIVQVYNVNVGDVVMINTYGHPATIAEGQIDKYGGIALAGHQLHSHDTVFRRIPETGDPRVRLERRRISGMPDYYMLPDGRDFLRFCIDEFAEDLKEFTPVEGHALLSALEHLFRQGRKPGMEQHDETAQAWWFGEARRMYITRKRAEWKGQRFPEIKTDRRYDLIVKELVKRTIQAKEQAERINF